MKAALTRYRVMAYVVGVMLLVLVCVAMPLKYLADTESVIAIVGPVHGFLYMVYLLAALDLAVRCRWKVGRTILVFLAGTIPFLSFIAERKISRQVEASMVEPAPAN